MARTDSDPQRGTWDLAAGVGAAATLVAAARAVATRGGLINDPFAEPLVRAAGVEFFGQVAGGELDIFDLGFDLDEDAGLARIIELFAARTRFFDDFFANAGRAGIRQAVILASGLDARPYRLWWPAGTTLFEIDQPQVIEFKTQTVRQLGARLTASRRAVGIDLRQDWPAALHRVGFDAAQPSAWIAEGLLIGFLPPEAQDRLLDSVSALSAAGSRFAADYMPVGSQSQAGEEQALADRWREHGLTVDLADLTYPSAHHDVADYLAAHGWETVGTTIADLFGAAGLPRPRRDGFAGAPVSLTNFTAVTATRSRAGRNAFAR